MYPNTNPTSLTVAQYVRAFPHVFDMYFASITSFQYHPANPPESRKSLAECAGIALDMIALRAAILAPLPEGVPVDGVDVGLEV